MATVAASALLFAAACHDTPRLGAGPTKDAGAVASTRGEGTVVTTLAGVEIKSTLLRHADRLEVHYRVDNRRSDTIAVLNQILRTGIDGGPEYSPDDVYIDLDDGALRLTKGALPVPEGLFLSVYPFPDALMIPPGTSFEETFRVPVPVKVRNPFRRRGKGETVASKRGSARSVVLEIGIVPPTPACIFTRSHPAYPDVWSGVWVTAKPGVQLECQTMLTARFELDESLPVLDYDTHPWP